MFVSPPVWRTTACSSPWGSPAAPRLLSGWISLKSVLVAANSFMHWEMEDFYYSPPDWLCCLFPPPSFCLPWLLSAVPFTARCQPCFCLPTPPRNAGWGLFHQVLLQLCPSALLHTKSKSLPPLAKILSHLPSSLWCSNFCPSPGCAFALDASPLPWPGSSACCPHAAPPTPAFLHPPRRTATR